MNKVLILYLTVDGHTRKICERLRKVIETPFRIKKFGQEPVFSHRGIR